jgi:hypothetical protein
MYGANQQRWFESPIQPAVTEGLAGLGSPNQLAVEMPDQTIRMFYGISTDLGAALSAGGRPQRPYDGTSMQGQSPQWGVSPNGYYTVTQFMGGFLLDGCPLNVIFGQGWLPGQQAALAASGIIPNCPQVRTAAPVSQVQTASIQAPTFNPVTSGGFTPTVTSGGIVTNPSSVTPQTAVYAPQAPAPPTQIWNQGGSGGSDTTGAALPSWLPYAAAAIIALLILRRK